MKKLIVLTLLVASVGGARAYANDESPAATADLAYASQYVFRGIKHANDSVQPSAEAAYGNAYLGVWSDQPLQSHRGDEADMYAGYKYTVTRAVSVEAVATYYDYPGAPIGVPRHSYEAGVGATLQYRGVAGSFYYYHDFKLNSDTEQVSLRYSIPLKTIGGSLDWVAYVGTVAARGGVATLSGRGHESYNYGGVDVTLPYQLSEKTNVALGAHFADREGLSAPDGNGHLWLTLSVTHAF